ncbi:MAG: DUF4286 family protein [Planctomycetota bacterium]|jgi:hypothetical protein
MYCYTVRCEFDDPALVDRWVEWLRDEHLAEVCDAGARDAEVIRLDGDPPRCEVRYHFVSIADFKRYERDHAPRLRAAGLERFPPERGVRYQRSTGSVVATWRP